MLLGLELESMVFKEIVILDHKKSYTERLGIDAYPAALKDAFSEIFSLLGRFLVP